MVTTGNTHVSRTKHCIKKFYYLISNIKNTVENMMHSRVFLTNFEVFGNMVKHYINVLHISSQSKLKRKRKRKNGIVKKLY